jgi:uncharacterized protein (DUF2249 family)
MTTTGTEALQAMLTHHAALVDGVDRRIAALRAATAGGPGHETARAALLAYVANEVLTHAAAEERTVYRAAAAKAELAGTVAGMTEEHRELAGLVERLATAADDRAAAATATLLGSLFAAHVAKENELILPPLADDEEADLAGLLGEMHRLIEAEHRAGDEQDAAGRGGAGGTSPGADPGSDDATARLFRLVLDGAGQLVAAGQGDSACRLAAEAWAAARTERPDLAAHATAALHRLVRAATAEPVAVSSKHRSAGAGPASDVQTLDVRTLAPARRHETIFATYGALQPGSGFVLLNDHDPKPLRYQFEAEHAGRFTWDVLEAGPAVWRVRIGRPAERLP